ncbi:hypothetical protein ASPZODRAFT_130163 [Penicilliopsis zonata CBS 506.65]|uniref:Ketoreductase (KR) domain-containing protein n=1 Tax=Penicilliopsis zonata CBS 506.65 TaxID=1073090 RepID=A0A1L9SM57_9EURO|nr:hypothetical protein ASPZODRAFT_130163 [Penicilliopsis zonata CBS 506.65]OJJ48213.1 hypothetical protein ASPZODRAFT_130163 [Penicilliopsis zonata CBS 506.65]
MALHNLLTQWFPPAPSFTENHLSSQKDRVFIVTGGNGGIGFELCKILYSTGASIYMASRSRERAEKAIEDIISSSSSTETGTIYFLPLDLNDLESVRRAASIFAERESRLDVLWNNAGMGGNRVAVGARTAQNLEAMVGINCVAAQLFTQLLVPQLQAGSEPFSPSASAVPSRVIWTSSVLAESGTPAHGIDFDALDEGTQSRVRNYAVSKFGNWMLGAEFARRHPHDIISVVINPGNLKTKVFDGTSALLMCLLNRVLYEVKLGAYTALYAGLSPEITVEKNGAYIIPWGRIREDKDCARKDLIQALTPVEEGGLGYSGRFWDWCEQAARRTH